MIQKIAFLFAVAAVVAVSASSQTVSYLNFGKGPAQWIMTTDEQRAWRQVTTEEQAHDFADLFWARRDPTPGTAANEIQADFESRVAYADKNFKEGNRPGWSTERGRVLLVLGTPASWTSEQEKRTSYMVQSDSSTPDSATDQAEKGFDPTGGRALAAKDIWTYSYQQAQKFGMPKIEVVFVFDGLKGAARRDPLRTDFTSALPAAIRSYVLNPQLTEVPQWASTRRRATIFERVPGSSEVTEQTVETTSTTPGVKRVIIDRPAPVALPAGAGKLTLVNDISSLRPQGASDPFAALQSVASFKRDQELGWTAEYCAGEISPEPPALKVALKLSGTAGGQTINMSSDPEEFVPDSIKASPGCYLVRGSLPLADVEPGSYTLSITLAGPREEQRYNLTREFRVE